MNKNPSSVDSKEELAALRRRHSDLDRRIKELEGQLAMTPEEQVERVRLKKEKLAAKDRIAELEGA